MRSAYKTKVKVVGKSRMKSLVKRGWRVVGTSQAFLGPPRYTVQLTTRR